MSRRKTLKKDQYDSFPNCFDQEADWKGRWGSFFRNDHPITLELGCGKAEFSYALAQKYPARNFIGVDVKADRMWRPAKEALEAGIENLAFLRTHLLQIRDHFDDNEVDEIWITFPDPFAKKRQAKHRMMNVEFLKLYRKILRPGGRLHFKTDNLELFQFGLEVFVREKGITLTELCFDLHGENSLPEDYKIKTTYEKRFLEMGEKINYTSFHFSDKL